MKPAVITIVKGVKTTTTRCFMSLSLRAFNPVRGVCLAESTDSRAFRRMAAQLEGFGLVEIGS
jgi:hypothetical protein